MVTIMDQKKHEASSAVNSEDTANVNILDADSLSDLVKLFKLLSDETRLQILFLLRQNKELNVRTLCGILQQSQPSVSHHLALLRVAGLLEMRREGKHNFYRVIPERLAEVVQNVFTSVDDSEPLLRIEDCVDG